MTPFVRLLLALLLALPAVWLGYVLSRDPGQVWIAWGRHQVDTTLAFLLLLLLALGLLLYLTDLVLRRWPRRWRARRIEARRKALLAGLKRLAEARYLDAKARLLRASSLPEQRELALFYAAQAAEGAGEREAALELWRSLAGAGRLAEAARAELHARGALDAGMPVPDGALAQRRQYERACADRAGLRVLEAADAALRRQALSAPEALEARHRWLPQALCEATDRDALEALWADADEYSRTDPGTLAALIEAAWRLDDLEYARQAVEYALKRQPHEAVFARYAELPIVAPKQLLERVEAWLREHPESAALYRLRGRCHAALGDRLAARRAWEHALVLEPHPAAWTELGRLADAEGDLKAARDAYRQALDCQGPHPRGVALAPDGNTA